MLSYTSIFLVDENYVGVNVGELDLLPSSIWAEDSLRVRIDATADWIIDQSGLAPDNPITQIVLFSDDIPAIDELISSLGLKGLLDNSLKIYYFGGQGGVAELQAFADFPIDTSIYYLGSKNIVASPLPSGINNEASFSLQLNQVWEKSNPDGSRALNPQEVQEISSLLADTTVLAPFSGPPGAGAYPYRIDIIVYEDSIVVNGVETTGDPYQELQSLLKSFAAIQDGISREINITLNLAELKVGLYSQADVNAIYRPLSFQGGHLYNVTGGLAGQTIISQNSDAYKTGIAYIGNAQVAFNNISFQNGIAEGGVGGSNAGAGLGAGGALFVGPESVVFLNNSEFLNNTATGGQGGSAQASGGVLGSQSPVQGGLGGGLNGQTVSTGALGNFGFGGNGGNGGAAGSSNGYAQDDPSSGSSGLAAGFGGGGGGGGGAGTDYDRGSDGETASGGWGGSAGALAESGTAGQSSTPDQRTSPSSGSGGDGAGLGGAIFLYAINDAQTQYANQSYIYIGENVSFSGNQVDAPTGAQKIGGDLFIYTNIQDPAGYVSSSDARAIDAAYYKKGSSAADIMGQLPTVRTVNVALNGFQANTDSNSVVSFNTEEGAAINLQFNTKYAPIDAPVTYSLWLDKNNNKQEDLGETTTRLEILRSADAKELAVGLNNYFGVESTLDLTPYFANDQQFTGDYTAQLRLFTPDYLSLAGDYDLSEFNFLVKEKNPNLLLDWGLDSSGLAVPLQLMESDGTQSAELENQKEFKFAFFQGGSSTLDLGYKPEDLTLYFQTSIQKDGSWASGDYLSVGPIQQNKLTAALENPESTIEYLSELGLYRITNFNIDTILTLKASQSDAKYAYDNLRFSIVDQAEIKTIATREYKSQPFAPFSLVIEGLGDEETIPTIQLNDGNEYFAVTIKLDGINQEENYGTYYAKISQARSTSQTDELLTNSALRILDDSIGGEAPGGVFYADLELTWNEVTKAWDNRDRSQFKQIELTQSNNYQATFYIQARGNTTLSAISEQLAVGLYIADQATEYTTSIESSPGIDCVIQVTPNGDAPIDPLSFYANGGTNGTDKTNPTGSREVAVPNFSPYQNTVELQIQDDYISTTRIILPNVPLRPLLYEGDSEALQIFFTLSEADLASVQDALLAGQSDVEVVITLAIEDGDQNPVNDVIVIKDGQKVENIRLTLAELVEFNTTLNNGSGEISGLSLLALHDQRLEPDQKPYTLVAGLEPNLEFLNILSDQTLTIENQQFNFAVSDEKPATGAFVAEVSELLLKQSEAKINSQLNGITGLPGIDSIGAAIKSELWKFQDELYQELKELQPTDATSRVSTQWSKFDVEYTFKNVGLSQGILDLNLTFDIASTDFNFGIGLSDDLRLSGQGEVSLTVEANFTIAYGLSDQAPALILKEDADKFTTYAKPSDFPNLKELSLPGAKQLTSKLSTFFVDTGKTELTIFAGIKGAGELTALLGPVTATIGIEEGTTKIGASLEASLEDYDYGRYIRIAKTTELSEDVIVGGTYGIGTIQDLEDDELVLFLTRERLDPAQLLLETLFGRQNNFPKQAVRVYDTEARDAVGIWDLNYLETPISDIYKTYVPEFATNFDFDDKDLFQYIDTRDSDGKFNRLFDDGEVFRCGVELADDPSFNDDVDGFTELYRYQPKPGFIFYDQNNNDKVDKAESEDYLAILDEYGEFEFTETFKNLITRLDTKADKAIIDNIHIFREDGDRAYLGEILSSTQDITEDFSFAKYIKNQFRAKASAEAKLVASLDADLDRLAGGLPAISADLILGYTGFAYTYDAQLGGLVRNKESEGFQAELNDITLDLGSFLTDLVEPTVNLIYEYLKPFDPLVSTLGEKVGILEPLGLADTFDRNSNGEATVIELAATIATIISPKSAPKIQRSLDSFDRLSGYWLQLKDLYNGLQALKTDGRPNSGGLAINLGSLEYGSDEIDPEADAVALDKRQELFAKINSAPAESDPSLKVAQEKTFALAKKVLKSNLQLPVFSLGGIKDIIEGEDTVLAALDLPRFDLEFNVEKTFNIWGPLSGKLFGNLALGLDVDFGFDTSGINSYIRTIKQLGVNPGDSPKILAEKTLASQKAALLPLDGFYISDYTNPDGTGFERPEINLSATVGVGAGLDLGILSGYVTGGITGDANLDIIDLGEYSQLNDGRVHFSEIVTLLNAGASPFRLYGGVDLFVGIEVSTFAAKVYEANLATLPLVRFDTGIPRASQLSSGSATDGRMSGVPVYFDANYNRYYDVEEAYTITKPDGSYDLSLSLYDFDIDHDGQITSRDGQLVFAGARVAGSPLPQGVDVSTGTLVDVPLVTLPDWQTATAASSIFSFVAKPDFQTISHDFLRITGQTLSTPPDVLKDNLVDFSPAEESPERSSYYYALNLLLFSIASNIEAALVPKAVVPVADNGKQVYAITSASLEALAEDFTGPLTISVRNQYGEVLSLSESTIYELPDIKIDVDDLQSIVSGLPQFLTLRWEFQGSDGTDPVVQAGEIPLFVDFSNPDPSLLEIRPQLEYIYHLIIDVYAKQLIGSLQNEPPLLFDLLTDQDAAISIQQAIASLLQQQGVGFGWQDLDLAERSLDVVFDHIDSIRSTLVVDGNEIFERYSASLGQLVSSNPSIDGLLTTTAGNLYHQLLAKLASSDMLGLEADPVVTYLLLGYDLSSPAMDQEFVDPKTYNPIDQLYSKRLFDQSFAPVLDDPDFANYKLDVFLNSLVKIIGASLAASQGRQAAFADYLSVYEALSSLVRQRIDLIPLDLLTPQDLKPTSASLLAYVADPQSDCRIDFSDGLTYVDLMVALKGQDGLNPNFNEDQVKFLQDLLPSIYTKIQAAGSLISTVQVQKVFQQTLASELVSIFSADAFEVTDFSWILGFDRAFEDALVMFENDPLIADPVNKPSLVPAPQLRADSLVLPNLLSAEISILPLLNDTFYGDSGEPLEALVDGTLLHGLEILPMKADGSVDLSELRDVLALRGSLQLLPDNLFRVDGNTLTFNPLILAELDQPLNLLYTVRDQQDRTYKGMLTLFRQGQDVTGIVENYQYRGFQELGASGQYGYFDFLTREAPDATQYQSLFGELLIDTTAFASDQMLSITASQYKNSSAAFSNIVAFYQVLDEFGSVRNPYYIQPSFSGDSANGLYLSDQVFLGLSQTGDFGIDQPDFYGDRTTIDTTKQYLLPFDHGYTTAALEQARLDALFLQTGTLISGLPARDTVTGSTISGGTYYLPILLANVGSLVAQLQAKRASVTFDSIIGQYVELYGQNPAAMLDQYGVSPLAYSASPIANPDFYLNANGEIPLGGDGLHFRRQGDGQYRYIYGFEDLPGVSSTGQMISDRDYNDGLFELAFTLDQPPSSLPLG